MEYGNKQFSLSYNQPLQDVAGNLLDVKITKSTYDPIAERLVEQMTERIKKVELTEEQPSTTVFKINTELANYAHAVPMVAEIKGLSPADFDRPDDYKRSNTVYDV